MEEFVKEMKEIHEKVKVALRKSQEEMKKYVDKNRKEVVEYKVGDRVLLSTKDLIWEMRNRETKKLTEMFVGPYKIKKNKIREYSSIRVIDVDENSSGG